MSILSPPPRLSTRSGTSPLLTRELIRDLGGAGLHALQISVDTVRPNAVTMKSLELLRPKLDALSEEAVFRVRINSKQIAGGPTTSHGLQT